MHDIVCAQDADFVSEGMRTDIRSTVSEVIIKLS